MRFAFKFKFFCLAFLLPVFFVFLTPTVNAGPLHNLEGWAWSDVYGWISFNSDDCSNDGNNYTGLPSGCPSTPYFDYGVSVDEVTGDFSGYAWNEAVGWISFERITAGNPPEAPYNLGTGSIANETGGVVTGWAKVLSLGEDGWIRFDHGASDQVTYDGVSEDFSGWAYGGDTGMGWISFNCADYTACSGGTNSGEIWTVNSECTSSICDDACSLSSYKVSKNDGLPDPPPLPGFGFPITGNVSGWAWSNMGWISFNSTDCDIDGDGVYEGENEDGGPVMTGCPTFGTVIEYAVNIDPLTGILSGYAWNEHVGWISFQESGLGPGDGDDTTPDLDFASECN